MTLQIHLQNPSEWMSKSYPAHWVHGLQQLSSKMRYVQVTCKQGVGMYIVTEMPCQVAAIDAGLQFKYNLQA